jgi:hypothetical protein
MVKSFNGKELEREVFFDSNKDGLGKLLLGIGMIGVAAASASLLFIPLFIIPIVFGGRIAEAVRKRLTYPRIGYVKLKEEQTGKALKGVLLYEFLVFLVSAIALYIIFGGVMEFRLWARWSPLVTSLLILGLFLNLHDKSGDKRYLGLAALSVLSGLVLSFVSFDISFPYLFGYFDSGVVFYFLLMGSVTLSSGIVQFIYFLYQNPISPEDRG